MRAAAAALWFFSVTVPPRCAVRDAFWAMIG
jgi:hypothetical protein